jgi:glycosyltransferase involved in cell wall biosynthesis
LNVISYIHPVRTYLPCTGAGRHINNTLLELAKTQEINLELLFSKQWLTPENRLPDNCPLRELPFQTFPMPENRTERLWKLTGLPRMDRYISDDTDWLFAPVETYFPVRKCPVAVTIHDIQAFEPHLPWSQTWQHRWFRFKWSQWVRRTFTDSRVIFTVSEFSKERMVKLLSADPTKIVVIRNGIEQPFFDIASTSVETLSSPVDSPYIFMIGGLRQKKGADSFLALAQALHQYKSDIQIVIAGSSEPDYVKAAAEYPNITLLGVVPDEDLPRLLRRSLCLLFLSLYEGFGIPALEAMAAGVPAVVSHCASLPEVVGDAGLVVDPANVGAIVEVLESLLKDAQLRQTYIDKGHQHAKQYTWHNCANHVIDAFQTFV